MNIVDFNYLKKQVLREHNRIRTDPKCYIPILKKYILYFNGNLFEKPNTDIGIQTCEGIEAFIEAIEFLQTQKPVCRVELDAEVSKASQEHCDYLGSKGICDHIGEYNSDYDERIEKYIEWEYAVAENIDFGANSGEEIVISFLVDDGIKERVHRDILFNKQLHHIGIGVGYHRKYKVCTVIDYVGKILLYKNKAVNINGNRTVDLSERDINGLLIKSQTKKLEEKNKKLRDDQDELKNSLNNAKSNMVAIANEKKSTLTNDM